MNWNTDGDAWAALVGAFMPIIISFIKSLAITKRNRALLAFFACVVAALGTAYFSGEWSAMSIVVKIATVLVMAQTLYRSIWKPSGLDSIVWATAAKFHKRVPCEAPSSFWRYYRRGLEVSAEQRTRASNIKPPQEGN